MAMKCLIFKQDFSVVYNINAYLYRYIVQKLPMFVNFIQIYLLQFLGSLLLLIIIQCISLVKVKDNYICSITNVLLLPLEKKILKIRCFFFKHESLLRHFKTISKISTPNIEFSIKSIICLQSIIILKA